MVVRDNRTGQTFQVDPNNAQQMAQYGIQPAGAAALQSKNITTPIAQGISAQAGADVASNTVGADIASKQAGAVSAGARSTVDVNQANQLAFISKIKDAFDKSKGKDGYVSPQTYNQAKADASKLNITGDAFDNTFGQSYTNPNNIYYDTPEAKGQRAIAQQVYNLIKDYHTLSVKGPEAGHLIDIPGIVGIGIGGDSKTYQQNVLNLSSDIRGLVGAAQGSGFRFNMQELNRIANLMPAVTDTSQQVNSKLDQIDQLMKTNMGVSLNDFIKADQGAQNG